jgi:hypothetical protein
MFKGSLTHQFTPVVGYREISSVASNGCNPHRRRETAKTGLMKTSLKSIGVIATLSAVGCATIMEGTGQSIAISTTPAGATCTVSREGGTLGQIASTPGSIRVDKSKNDIAVACSKSGYQTATITHSPHFVGTTFGNIALGGGTGAVVDASTGANYEYPAQINVELAPLSPAAPVAALGVARYGDARP